MVGAVAWRPAQTMRGRQLDLGAGDGRSAAQKRARRLGPCFTYICQLSLFVPHAEGSLYPAHMMQVNQAAQYLWDAAFEEDTPGNSLTDLVSEGVCGAKKCLRMHLCMGVVLGRLVSEPWAALAAYGICRAVALRASPARSTSIRTTARLLYVPLSDRSPPLRLLTCPCS